jgi:hypothetical protein
MFFCLRRRKCQDKKFEIEGQLCQGKSDSQKWKGKVEAWRKAPCLFCISFLFYGFFFPLFFFFLLFEKKKMQGENIKIKG